MRSSLCCVCQPKRIVDHFSATAPTPPQPHNAIRVLPGADAADGSSPARALRCCAVLDPARGASEPPRPPLRRLRRLSGDSPLPDPRVCGREMWDDNGVSPLSCEGGPVVRRPDGSSGRSPLHHRLRWMGNGDETPPAQRGACRTHVSAASSEHGPPAFPRTRRRGTWRREGCPCAAAAAAHPTPLTMTTPSLLPALAPRQTASVWFHRVQMAEPMLLCRVCGPISCLGRGVPPCPSV